MEIVVLVTDPATALPAFEPAAFCDHVGAALSLPESPGSSPSGLVVSEVLKPLGPSDDVRAMVQLWWADPVDEASVDSLLDEVAASSGCQLSAWTAREHVLKAPHERERSDPSPDVVKLVGTAYRRDDFSREAFFAYWRETHAPISGSVPGVGGYIVSELLGTVRGELSPDAFIEQWWPDEATFDRSENSPEAQAAWEDVGRYAKTTGVFWLMRERILVVPQATGSGLLEGGNA